MDRYAVRSCESVIERIFRGCSWGTARVKRERISYVFHAFVYSLCACMFASMRAPWTVFSRVLRVCWSTWLRWFPSAYSAPH